MTTEYSDFLDAKRVYFDSCGFEIKDNHIHEMLFPFQRHLVKWACRQGMSALFADTGLGKTFIQLEWARLVYERIAESILIVAPLAVSRQTVKEGQKIGIDVHLCKDQSDVKPGINITNYERIEKFDASAFGGIVLDESSILKSYDGSTRKLLTTFASGMSYRLACTATPAPNDLIELTNHAEFLGVMSGKEIIALFFIQDGNTTHKWRLKKHSVKDFWRWMASWCCAIRKPSDMGYEDGGFNLPLLHTHEHTVDGMAAPEGQLFDLGALSLLERRRSRKGSLSNRIDKVAELVAQKPDVPWLIWCDLNCESEALTKAIPDAVEIRGKHSAEYKEEKLLGFASGDVRILVTKPSIAGFGMNFQHCSNMVFTGLSDSYEQYYQAVRRCWRFGQENEVNTHIVISESEGCVRENIARKEAQATVMMDSIVREMKDYQLKGFRRGEMEYTEDVQVGTNGNWKLYKGDSCELIKQIGSDSVGLTVFSPPFPGMYAYTNSSRDIGNCKDYDQLIEHFSFLMPELLRVTKQGRSCCIHLTQEPVFKRNAGHIGLRDFRGKVIQNMESHGWHYYGEVCIDKNPQLKASRTKEQTLLFKTLGTDSSTCRMALADYILQFKKPGDNLEPIPAGTHPRWNPDGGWITSDEWIEWAAPVWYRQNELYPGGIRETDVLQVRHARNEKDERHLCPLQLGVIERCVKLWSNPDDVVFSPFVGIGSEGYVALKFNRRFVGIELKPDYFNAACNNLIIANRLADQGTLFDSVEAVNG